jgi:hypothetical protein
MREAPAFASKLLRTLLLGASTNDLQNIKNLASVPSNVDRLSVGKFRSPAV